MKLNMGLDRRMRLFLVAPALVVTGILIGPGGIVPIVMYVLAGVMVATSLAGTCPATHYSASVPARRRQRHPNWVGESVGIVAEHGRGYGR